MLALKSTNPPTQKIPSPPGEKVRMIGAFTPHHTHDPNQNECTLNNPPSFFTLTISFPFPGQE